MAELVWSEGMSVGIEAIDNDHKKIIAIIAKLMNAKNNNPEVISDIFQSLENYVVMHFSREEALLENVGYKDLTEHKKSHQDFIDKIPKLKQEWLEKNSFETSEKINEFLHNWLINHILIEDMDYTTAVFTHQQKTAKKTPKSFVQQLSSGLSHRIKLSRRVFLTTFIPVIGVVALCAVILVENYQRYNNMSLMLGLNSILSEVNALSHSLQSERGLSSGYASSNYQRFGHELQERRVLTDNEINSFLKVIDEKIAASVRQNVMHYADNIRSNFKALYLHRQRLDEGQMSFEQTYVYYTNLIRELLSISEHLVHIDMDAKLVNDISAIGSMLLYKEFAGQIRAAGMQVIESGQIGLYKNIEMGILVGKQLNILHSFAVRSSDEQKIICHQLCDASLQRQITEQGFITATSQEDSAQRSRYWFDHMSIRIDKMQGVAHQLISEFNKKTLLETQRLQRDYYTIWILLSIVVALTLVFSAALNQSIISPIRKVTDALNQMANGHKNIQLKEETSTDEIGAMHKAYEKLRRKILQADIFQALVFRQQKIIEYRKSQQEHFQQLALTDALTGAVNRHHFNDVLAKEVSNVDKEDKPLSIMLLDIDFFKKINDTYGHVIGDEVLVMFYQACKKEARNTDVVARIGGEEFVIVMPNTSMSHAHGFAERLRKKVESLEIIVDENIVKLTVSIGVAQWDSAMFGSTEDFIVHVDKSLYHAKNTGRNNVVKGHAPS